MKKLVALIFVLALAAGGGWLWTIKPWKSRGASMQTVAVAKGAIMQTIEATGSVSPLNRVEIKPPIAGRIEKLLVAEGDRVKEGQVLAWMSSSDRAAILDAARSQGPEAVKRWEDAYKPTPIIAPLSGVVILKNVVVGETVDPTAVLFAMSDYLIVLAQVDEADIGHVHVGMPSLITLDAYPDKKVEGKVFDILYEGKNVSNVITYGVKVRPTKVPSFFRSQMTANIGFIVKSKDSALVVPVTVVQDMANGIKQVSIPGVDGKPVIREIKTGIENNDMIEVLSGVALGDKILITRGKYVPQQGPQSSPLTSGRR